MSQDYPRSWGHCGEPATGPVPKHLRVQNRNWRPGGQRSQAGDASVKGTMHEKTTVTADSMMTWALGVGLQAMVERSRQSTKRKQLAKDFPVLFHKD